ncbi:MAG TPA: hypothetical protein VJN69_13030 [Candidatus Acidoferrales bacterium]|nr:hypothetical protein [Candidatus Acidoferrales bacterium]
MRHHPPTGTKNNRLFKWFLFAGAAVVILFGALYLASVTIIAPKLVDTARQRTQDYLSKRFKSSVQIAAFHLRVFPTIRVEADGIVLRHQGRTDIPPMITIEKASFDANFEGLIGRKVDVNSVQLQGLTVNTPPRKPGGPPMFKGTDDNLAEKYPVVIHHIIADDVSLVMLRKPEDSGKSPNVFEIHALRLQNFSFSRPASFQALLTNPKPHGLIHCQGEFGPWLADDPSETPVAGAYTFQNADMSTLKGLKGTMQSTGHFRGPLDYLNVDGETEIPDFALRTSAHPMALHTDYSAIVDGTNGNTILKNVTASFLHTTLSVHGEVVDLKKKTKGRTIELYTTSGAARIEDLLTLAVDTSPPAMTGPVQLNARIDIPEEDTDLIDRMIIDGHFGVGDMQFTNPAVQSKVDSLSRRAQGQPKNDEIADELSLLKGTFKMADSTIDMSNLVFAVDGANIDLAGAYQVDSGQLDFRGHLKMDAKISQTTTGIKSFFLKAVDPFFEKKGAGTYLPIKITGTKDHPNYGLDFHDKANQEEKSGKAKNDKDKNEEANKDPAKAP